MAGLCIQRSRPAARRRWGKVKEKNPSKGFLGGPLVLPGGLGTAGAEAGGCGAESSHLLPGCPPAVCELGVGTVHSIDPEKWTAGRENVETGGKRTGSGRAATGRGVGEERRRLGENRGDGGGSRRLRSPAVRSVSVQDALCGQSVGSQFFQWSPRPLPASVGLAALFSDAQPPEK